MLTAKSRKQVHPRGFLMLARTAEFLYNTTDY